MKEPGKLGMTAGKEGNQAMDSVMPEVEAFKESIV